jgi:hypothetical protein
MDSGAKSNFSPPMQMSSISSQPPSHSMYIYQMELAACLHSSHTCKLDLGCKFRSRFRSLMGRNSVRTRNEAQSSGGAVSVSVVFSSTWRQLNLNFLDSVGFSLRCKDSKPIDKPSPYVLGLLCSGEGRSNQPMCERKTVRAAKPQSEHSRPKNSGIRYVTETPTGVSAEFAT